MAQRVLIVEDEPDIRDLLVFHLEREGYQVAKARSGADALRQAQASPPDLVLLDLMLPEMDGLEVCRRLRQDPAHRGGPDRHAHRPRRRRWIACSASSWGPTTTW